MKQSRAASFVVVAISYLVALAVGLILFERVSGALWMRVFIADVGATVVIYLLSLIVQNASLYDPYWSVQPMVILAALAIGWRAGSWDVILLLAVVCLWGIRLTANWAYTFHGLDKQDWRYDMLAQKTGKLFFLVDFLGIQMFPTLVVYTCILPGIRMIETAGSQNGWCIIGALVCLVATALQLVADVQMQKFRKGRKNRGELISIGLWKYARHPNYLGEILMWWGVYLMMVVSCPESWYLGAGALLNTLMFLCISIPMAEKRLAQYKPEFAAYRERTRMLLPIKK